MHLHQNKILSSCSFDPIPSQTHSSGSGLLTWFFETSLSLRPGRRLTNKDTSTQEKTRHVTWKGHNNTQQSTCLSQLVEVNYRLTPYLGTSDWLGARPGMAQTARTGPVNEADRGLRGALEKVTTLMSGFRCFVLGEVISIWGALKSHFKVSRSRFLLGIHTKRVEDSGCGVCRIGAVVVCGQNQFWNPAEVLVIGCLA